MGRSGLPGVGLCADGRHSLMAARERPGSGDSREPGCTRQENGGASELAPKSLRKTQMPQPSDEDGVPEDMATLVLDNPALGARPGCGRTQRPDD